MPADDELVRDWPDVTWNGAAAPVWDVPGLESIRRALDGAILFAESFLEAGGAPQLSRLICTPDARYWSLAFGESFFEVEVQADGFSVRALRSSRPAVRALRREA
jgi:hypothetical protein